MARRPDLEIFAKEHGLKFGTIADLIHHRFLNERTVDVMHRAPIQTDFGVFDLWMFNNKVTMKIIMRW
jgi:3,4-dihydroxy 2-butanone 4-phosphate synthase/GTP cyclohydrolase II